MGSGAQFVDRSTIYSVWRRRSANHCVPPSCSATLFPFPHPSPAFPSSLGEPFVILAKDDCGYLDACMPFYRNLGKRMSPPSSPRFFVFRIVSSLSSLISLCTSDRYNHVHGFLHVLEKEVPLNTAAMLRGGRYKWRKPTTI